MKLLSTLAISFAAATAAVDAQRTYNATAAAALGGWDGKFRCLTTKCWLPQIPACLRACTVRANRADGCAFDDFACHCVNYQAYKDIIEPCALPPSAGGTAPPGSPGCSRADLNAAFPVITSMCNFFNATLYGAYTGCAAGGGGKCAAGVEGVEVGDDGEEKEGGDEEGEREGEEGIRLSVWKTMGIVLGEDTVVVY